MRVLKIGGRAQSDSILTRVIRDAWRAAPGALCVIHGGGDEVSAMQRALGREAAFVGGRRVTSQGDLELLRMVLSGVVNKRLVSALVAADVPAVGLSGEDGALISAEFIDRGVLGYAGRPVSINKDLLLSIMNFGYLPIISPVAFNSETGVGGALNVNGDDAAAAIAAALGASELMLVVDVEGVLDEDNRVISSLTVEQAREMIANGTAAAGMAAKLESAESALMNGVTSVRICALRGVGDPHGGTFLTQSQSVAI
ncbi:MAG TPA: acetylglutamate kinase [Gemmatimonadaceae bacterium]|nr:acetylglutamate kinase [Gemmatimonadaceae bacterium]